MPVHQLQPNPARAGTESAGGAEYGGCGLAGTHTGIEVWGSSAAVPAVRHLRSRRCRSVALHVSELGRWRSYSLQPLVELMRRYGLNATKLHGDDIPVPVLDPGRGKTKT